MQTQSIERRLKEVLKVLPKREADALRGISKRWNSPKQKEEGTVKFISKRYNPHDGDEMSLNVFAAYNGMSPGAYRNELKLPVQEII